MSVQIIINGENAAEALSELSNLSGGFAAKSAAPVAEAPKTERAPRTTRTKTEPLKEESPAAEPEELEVSDEDVEALGGDASDDAPVPSDVELRALASTVGAKGPDAKRAIKALLDKYGVPNITAVPADKRIAFKAELEQL
ncbi:hypothetical protein [Cohnella sp. GCM10012308]|uniref:hypothetical protein n=1 Tax=Cohnella sp. GCM10012308 TaxID=3317329 RepID=UPI0036091215